MISHLCCSLHVVVDLLFFLCLGQSRLYSCFVLTVFFHFLPPGSAWLFSQLLSGVGQFCISLLVGAQTVQLELLYFDLERVGFFVALTLPVQLLVLLHVVVYYDLLHLFGFLLLVGAYLFLQRQVVEVVWFMGAVECLPLEC